MKPRTIGTNLRDRREELKKTQEDIGALTGIRQTYISRWEKGKAKPSPLTLLKLAVALETDVETLIEGIDPAYDQAKQRRHLTRHLDGSPSPSHTSYAGSSDGAQHAQSGGGSRGGAAFSRAVFQPPLSDNDQVVIDFFTDVSERCAEAVSAIRRRALGQHAATAPVSQTGTRDPHPRPRQQASKARGR